MKKRLYLELVVGFFMAIGLLCLAYLSFRVAQVEVWGMGGYEVFAIFSDSGGLKRGAAVTIAGVNVGHVERIGLADDEARVVMQLQAGLQIHEDAIASVKTSGLIGEKYVQISVGSAEQIVKPGERIRQTEAAVDIEALISKYAFGSL